MLPRACYQKKAVITIPSRFDASQRHLTRVAWAKAGMDLLLFIPGTSAIGFTYALENRQDNAEMAILVVNMGGGSLDVALLSIDQGIVEVNSVAGDLRLGGSDFDDRLVRHLTEFTTSNCIRNPLSLRAYSRLRIASGEAKRSLSSTARPAIELDAFHDRLDFHTTVTRSLFEELSEDIFLAVKGAIEQVFSSSNHDPSIVDAVLLTGGCARIPMMRAIVFNMFTGRDIPCRLYSNDSAVCGAALYAAILTGDQSPRSQDLLLLDAFPISLGIGTVGGLMVPIIKRHTTVPTKKTVGFMTATDFQAHATLQRDLLIRWGTDTNRQWGTLLVSRENCESSFLEIRRSLSRSRHKPPRSTTFVALSCCSEP
jgi:heat shock protein 1/8